MANSASLPADLGVALPSVPKKLPCRQCRSAKVKCDWADDTAQSCVRCTERGRTCTAVETPVRRVNTDQTNDPDSQNLYGHNGLFAPRRAKWVCAECKKRKRACAGGKPIFVPEEDRHIVKEENEEVGRATSMDFKAALDPVGMTPCDFCTRHSLECRWPELDSSIPDLPKAAAKRKPFVRVKKTTGQPIVPRAESDILDLVPAAAGQQQPELTLAGPPIVPARVVSAPPAINFGFGPPFLYANNGTGGMLSPMLVPNMYSQQVPANYLVSTPPPLSPGHTYPSMDLQISLGGSADLGLAYSQPTASPTAFHQIPRPVSAIGATLPSSDCLQWLLSRFWLFHSDMGRNIPIHRPKFLRSAWTSSGDSLPLLWILLWGTTVFLDTPVNRHNWSHPELNIYTKTAIRERARIALIAGLQEATSDLAAIEAAQFAVPREALLTTVRRLVPVLQGLTLGMMFYEKTGGTRNMVALVSLVIRLGAVSAQALKSWINGVSPLLQRDPAAPFPVAEPAPVIEQWLRDHNVTPPLPRNLSLAASNKTPLEFARLSAEQQDEVILLAEYSACFFFAYGVDAWAADFLGTPLNISLEETGHVPVSFDTRGIFDSPDVRAMPYIGKPANFLPLIHLCPIPPPGLRFLPTLPLSLALSWTRSDADNENTKAMLVATVTDCFRSGFFFLVSSFYELERLYIDLRVQARQQGFKSLYPHAIRHGPALDVERRRILGLFEALLEALPREAMDAVERGDMKRLFELSLSCPELPPSMTFPGALIWIFESIASLCSPPPEFLPEQDWYGSEDGIKAATMALRNARLMQAMLDFGWDVNNLLMFTWFQAKIDRTTRILFLHLQNPTSLFPSSVLQAAMVSCLSWLQSLGNGERYTEWIERLSQLSRGQWKQHATEENSNASSSVGSVFSRMVISNEDKKLEQFRQEMTSVESAVQSLV